MTTSNYITEITNGILSLVNENPDADEENNLSSNEYFAFLFFTEYHSFLRNYPQYRGKYNYNGSMDCYDIDVFKQDSEDGYYITKHFNKFDQTKGRNIIITTADITKCINLDEI